MKTPLYLILALFATFTLTAQTPYKTETITPNSSTKKLSIDLEYASLKVQVGNYQDVSVEAFVNIGDNKHNDAFSMEIEENNGALYIKTKMDNAFLKSYNNFHTVDWEDEDEEIEEKEIEDDRKVIINGKAYVYEKNNYQSYNHGIRMELYLVIKVPERMGLDIETLYGRNHLEGVTSNTKVKAVYGEIEASLNRTYNAKELDFNSTYGTVDIAIPTSLKANINLTTGYGKIYTDLDIKTDVKKKSDNCMFGDDVSAEMNGGGISLRLNSGYANIYLRKS